MTRSPFLLLAMIWIVAFNLRAGLIGLGPILPGLTDDLRLSHVQASILVAIPTAIIGLGALPGGWLADRWGPTRLITLGLMLTAFGGAARAGVSSFVLLVVMTIVFGAGIGLTQPSLPHLTRLWFPTRIGLATGIYASGLVAGATFAVAVTAPVILPMVPGETWRLPLAVWGTVAFVAVIAWVLVMRPWQPPPSTAPPGSVAPTPSPTFSWSPWRVRQFWTIALICGGQGVVYYLAGSWLPAIYTEAGVSLTRAGFLVGAFNLAALPSIAFIPTIAHALNSRRLVAIISSGLVLVGGLGLVLAPVAPGWEWLWGPLTSSGVSGLFGLSLMLPAELAPAGHTGSGAGMVLGIGFCLSAMGPILAGGLRDLTGSFQTATMIVPITAVILIILSTTLPDDPRRVPAAEPAQAVPGG